MPWLEGWSNRIELTIDSDKVDQDLTDFPVLIALTSGTGRNNADVTAIFDDLTVTSSGTIDSYTKLLLHMDGDSSALQHTATSNGNPQLTTISPYDTFGGSMYFDGTGDYLTVADHSDLDFGTEDFTIECWVKLSSLGSQVIIVKGLTSSTIYYDVVGLSISSSNKASFSIITASPNQSVTAVGDTTLTTDVWYHIAGTLVNSTRAMEIFVDGSSDGTNTAGSAIDLGDSEPLSVGSIRHDVNGWQSFFTGYITGVRWSKGIVRWDDDFTPPTTPYSTTTVSGIDSYTKLMLHFDGDQSSSGHTVTFNGNPQMTASVGTFDGSYYFDGTGDYLEIADHDDFHFGTGDFCIEYWLYPKKINIYYLGNHDPSIGWHFYSAYSIRNHINSSGKFGVGFGGPDFNLASVSDIALNVWTHISYSREGNTFRLFINGIMEASNTSSAAMNVSPYPWAIGRLDYSGQPGTEFLEGYIDEFRISKGVARLPSQTPPMPPSLPYPQQTEIVGSNDKKIAITSDDGQTRLYTEIEDWNPYTQEAYLWTKVPTIVSGTDTTLYLYYDSEQNDNDSYVNDTGTAAAQSVWNNDYVGVWHLSQDPSGAIADITDSTSNTNNNTPSSMEFVDLIDGKISKALNFDEGEFTYVDDNSLDVTTQITLETTLKMDRADNYILGNAWNNSNHGFYTWRTVGTGKLSFDFYDGSGGVGYTVNVYQLPTNEWHYLTATHTWGNGSLTEIQVDAVEKPGTWAGDGDVASSNDTAQCRLELGHWYGTPSTGSAYTLDGKLDEVRISSTARSGSWLKATYYSNWNNFVSFGTPDTSGPPVHSFSGYVYQFGEPVARIVRAYLKETGELIDEAVSVSGTGYYYLTTTISGPHYIVCLDAEELPDFNHQIISSATPQIIT